MQQASTLTSLLDFSAGTQSWSPSRVTRLANVTLHIPKYPYSRGYGAETGAGAGKQEHSHGADSRRL